ncbi:MAG: NAD(P)/FAD-dependent oxidoreductase [Haloarculaceae archaeon]
MRVAVLGAGYAGLTLATRLEATLPDDVDLVVVDEDGTHLVQHELHRVVRRPGLAEEITIDLAEQFDRATVREATVTDVDPDAGAAMLDANGTEERLEYDVGAVCLGAETEYYDLPGVRAHATPLKRLDHAAAVRDEFLDLLGAEAEADERSDAEPPRVVVGGAGLSGIQVAGELAALARERAASDAVEIRLVEREDDVAPNFPANFRRAVRNQLEERGALVRTGARVASADADRIAFDGGEDLAYDQFVWTGGIRGPAALDGERPATRQTLRLRGDTFVLGDAARVVDADGEAVPASAQAAIREARVAARNVGRLVTHRREGAGGFEPRMDGYRFESRGWLVSVGDGAVAQVGPTVLTGRPAKLIKASVGAGYLTSVGAVENAVDLVREELGWPTADDAEPPVQR